MNSAGSSWAECSTPNPKESRTIPRRSIVVKLALFVGVLVTVTAGSLITVGYFSTSAILHDQIDARLSATADDRQMMLLTALSNEEERVGMLASRGHLRRLLEARSGREITPEQFREQAEESLEAAGRNALDYLAIWIGDDAGTVLAAAGPPQLVKEFASREGKLLPQGGDRGLLGTPRQFGDSHAALFGAVIRSQSGQALARVFLLVDFNPVIAEATATKWLGKTGEILIGVRDGDRIRFLFPPRLQPRTTDFSAGELPSMARAIAGEAGFMRAIDRRNREVLSAYRSVGYAGWGLCAEMDVAEAYEPVDRLRRLLLGIGGVILVGGLSASYLIARQAARPIRRLARRAETIAGEASASHESTASGDEITVLNHAFDRMTERLARSYADFEQRLSDRTRDLEAMRDLLDSFFRISTSQVGPDQIERTFESVLRFCGQLGYDLAMISLVDVEAGVVRAVRGAGSMIDLVGLTVRPLEGDDILAIAVREGEPIVVADSAADIRCDQAAVALAGIHGQIILPLADGEVLGVLQVATREILEPEQVDLRPLKTLASHTARVLAGLKHVEEIRRLNQSLEQHANELVRSEAAVREQTRILQSVLECMGDGVVVADRDARFLVFNPAAQRILGRGPTNESSEDWSRLYKVYRPDQTTPYPVEELPLMRALRGESVDHDELYIAYPSWNNGTWITVSGRPLRDDQGAIQGGVVVLHEITRRKRTERRLAVHFATTRVLAEVDSLSEAGPRILGLIGEHLGWDLGAFWRVDHGRQKLHCVSCWHVGSESLTQLESRMRGFSFSRGIGLPGRIWASRQAAWISDLDKDAALPRWSLFNEEGLKSGFGVPILLRDDCVGVLEFFSREARPFDPDLLRMMVNLASQIGQFIERHRMHARVLQSEKLASLGMLSAGVAHEINNPLAYIANNLAVLERDVRSLLGLVVAYEKGSGLVRTARPDIIDEIDKLSEECDLDYIKENLDKILGSTRQGVKRVAEIVNNLRGFARVDRTAVDQVDLRDALSTALEMIRGRLQRRQIAVDQHLDDLPLVSASPVQLNQVFLNLLVNAMQAIESAHREDGRIVIMGRTQPNEVVIEVTDNGCGIPADVLPQIFDPFFTTKSVGDGTGLGLSITHGIIQDHGGRLEVESTPSQGTCFRVILPAARK